MAAIQVKELDAQSGCMCLTLNALGKQLREFCEGGPPEDEPAWLRLQRMHEEHEQELAAEKERKAEEALIEEQQAAQMQEEMRLLEQRRSGMDAEQLKTDSLVHFATLELFNQGWQEAMNSAFEALPVDKLEANDSEVEDEESDWDDEEPVDGKLPVDAWLAEHLKLDANGARENHLLHVSSCGELPNEECVHLATSLTDALKQSSDEASLEVGALVRKKESSTMLGELDRLIEKYSRFEDIEEGDETESNFNTEVEDAHQRKQIFALKARTTRHQAVADRLSALLPVLEGDSASTRLATSLALLDSSSNFARNRTVSIESVEEPKLRKVPSCCSTSSLPDVSNEAQPQAFHLSTADICWALCSEKRHLIAEGLLPSTGSDGRWSWRELRFSGLGWWLRGTDLEAMVTKLAQSAVKDLRRWTSDWISRKAISDKNLRRLVDEAVFWYALLDPNISKLRALLKTPAFRSEPALSALVEHPRSSEPEFLRKNAFRLLQLQRYHLAAALFELSGSYQDAARVAATHLHDMQLMIILVRRRRELAEPILKDLLESSPQAARDPWLRLLLAWHAGDIQLSRSIEAAPLSRCLGAEESTQLFDNTLRVSSDSSCLSEVEGILLATAWR